MALDTLMRWTWETDQKISKPEQKTQYDEMLREDKNSSLEHNSKDEGDNMNEINIGVVAAEFNYDVTYAMLELAKEHANFLGARVEKIMKVPGVFDIPLGVKKLMQNSEIHAVVALGAVVEGQTEHDEIIAQHATRKIVDLSLEYNKPIGLGISGPGMSRLEAHERVEYAKRAVEAAVKMVKKLRGEGEYSSGSTSLGSVSSDSEERAFAGLREMG